MSEIKFNQLRRKEMSIDDLYDYMLVIAEGKRFSADDKIRIETFLPHLIENIIKREVPETIRLPSGESIKGASRIVALKCQCICLARRSFGKNYYNNHPIYESLAKDLLFFIMRDYFKKQSVMGEFCCPTCTLSLLPLYTSNAFRWVDCEALKENVIQSLVNKQSIFEGNYHKKYAQWIVKLSGLVLPPLDISD